MNARRYSVFSVALIALACVGGCDGPSEEDLRPVVLVTVRGLSSDITSLRVRAEVNGAPAMNEQEYTEGLGSPDLAEYRFAVRLPVRTRGRLELSLWTKTTDGCHVSENLRESTQVEPGQFQEMALELHRFEQVMCPVTVNRVGGEGLVRWNPDRQACGGTCTERFPRGQVVTLSADGNNQTTLQQWEGACSGQAPCQVVVSGPRQVTARFKQTLRVIPSWPQNQQPPALDSLITSTPEGIKCDGKCTAGFPEGETVRLTAVNRGQLCFIGWGGPCAGNGDCYVKVENRTEVTAAFAECTNQGGTTSNSITSIWAVDSSNIWAAAGTALLQSTDGKTWKSVWSSDYTLNKVWSGGLQNEAWISRSKSGSNYITKLTLPAMLVDSSLGYSYATAMWAYTADELWVATGSRVGRLGRTDQPLNNTINSLHGSAANDVWLVGDGGMIARWNGTAWTPFNASGPKIQLTGVWAASTGSAWAVGITGTILRWDGANWNPVDHKLTTNTLSGVWGRNAEDVWAVGAGGLVLHWDGRVWAKIQSPISSDLNAIHGVNGNVWVGGNNGTLVKFAR